MASDRVVTWLLFDGECRVCSAVAACLRALDLRGRLRVRPIQESQGLLHGVPVEDALGAVHAVAPDGRVTAGAEAVPVILAALSGGPGLETLLRSSPPAMHALTRAYEILVDLRGRLTCGVALSSAARIPR